MVNKNIKICSLIVTLLDGFIKPFSFSQAIKLSNEAFFIRKTTCILLSWPHGRSFHV